MKVIIAGSRTIWDVDKIRPIIDKAIQECKLDITEIVSGNARGVDRAGEAIAKEREIPVKIFKADWKTHGRSAGMVRNGEMAKYGEFLIAIWDGESPGTSGMVKMMLGEKKPLVVYKQDGSRVTAYGV